MLSISRFGTLVVFVLTAIQLGGCATAPKPVDRGEFLQRAQATRQRFEASVPGLRDQIQGSAGYIVFPGVAQWGIIFSGGSFGRGALYNSEGRQIGWSAINVGSIGLQAGVQGFRMIIVFQNEQVLAEFKANKLDGSVTGVVVLAEAGGSGQASFTDGVAVYQGANVGLMGGINVGLNYIRYVPLGES